MGGWAGWRRTRGDGVYGSSGGFDYAAREARRELLKEAQDWRLARLARQGPGFRERFARLLRRVGGFWESFRLRGSEDGTGVVVGGVPDLVYLDQESTEGCPTVTEVYLGVGGRVVRKTDLDTGETTDSFVVGGWIGHQRSGS